MVYYFVFFSVVFLGPLFGQVSVPQGVKKLLENPTSITSADADKRVAQLVGEDGVLIETPNEISLLKFKAGEKADDPPFHTNRKYEYITYLKKSKLVVKGRGDVVEKNIVVSRAIRRPEEVFLADDGSSLIVRCGTFSVLWSPKDYIYIGPDVKIEAGSEYKFWVKLKSL